MEHCTSLTIYSMLLLLSHILTFNFKNIGTWVEVPEYPSYNHIVEMSVQITAA